MTEEKTNYTLSVEQSKFWIQHALQCISRYEANIKTEQNITFKPLRSYQSSSAICAQHPEVTFLDAIDYFKFRHILPEPRNKFVGSLHHFNNNTQKLEYTTFRHREKDKLSLGISGFLLPEASIDSSQIQSHFVATLIPYIAFSADSFGVNGSELKRFGMYNRMETLLAGIEFDAKTQTAQKVWIEDKKAGPDYGEFSVPQQLLSLDGLVGEDWLSATTKFIDEVYRIRGIEPLPPKTEKSSTKKKSLLERLTGGKNE